MLSCKKCGKDFTKMNDLKRHMARKIPCDGETLDEKVKKLVKKEVKKKIRKASVDSSSDSDDTYFDRIEALDKLPPRSSTVWRQYCAKYGVDCTGCKSVKTYRRVLERHAEKNLDIEYVVVEEDLTLKKPQKARSKAKAKAKPKKAAAAESDSSDEEKEGGNAIASFAKACHNRMRNEDHIVGTKAMHDIMRAMFLYFLEPHIDAGTVDMLDPKYYMEDQFYQPEMEMLSKFSNFVGRSSVETDDVTKDMWKSILFNHPLTRKIFNVDDNFNCSQSTLFWMCKKIQTDMEKVSFDSLDHDAKGRMYEEFLNGYSNNAGKEFGQYFTSRQYIHLVFSQLSPEFVANMKAASAVGTLAVLDPCMGTAGFLTESYKLFEMHKNHDARSVPGCALAGCEIEAETYSYALMNIILNTGNLVPHNFTCGDSLVDSDPRIKVDFIPTNPPYGTKMNYKDLKVKYEAKWKDVIEEDDEFPAFEEVFPLKTNNGVALFLQMMAFKLKPGGMAVPIIPNGELLFSKKFGKLRKYIMTQCDVPKIMYTPGGVFKHAKGVKTAVIYMRKRGEAEAANLEVEFVETTKALDEPTPIDKITITAENNWSWDASYYKAQEIPTWSGCEWKTLGDVCEIEIGGTPKRNYSEYWGGDNIWVSVSEMDGGVICDSKEKITDKGVKNSSVKLVKVGSIMMSFKLSIGKMSIAGCDLYTNEAIASMNPDKSVSKSYLFKYLSYNTPSGSSGSIGGNLSKASIKALKIPVPSLELQEEIVIELDKIEEAKKTTLDSIESKKAMIDSYRKFITPPFHEHPEIEWKALGDVCDSINGKALSKKDFVNGEYPVIGGGRQPVGYHNEFNVEADNILCSSSGYAGQLSRYDAPVWASDCFAIIPTKVAKEYLWKWMTYNPSKIEAFRTGSGQPHVNWKDLKALKIPVPSLELQEEFVKFYQAKDEKIKDIEAQIAKEHDHLKFLDELGRQVIAAKIR